MNIEIPAKVSGILEELKRNGYDAYVVGGCVRDSIMGKAPKDWDITTSASPQEVKRIFHRTVDTGILHGTVTVMLGKEGFEVTTYRIDGDYEDSRHPKQVVYTDDLIQDLERRDFTINAMAYNASTGLVDAFRGLEDLGSQQIRCVGSAEQRFEEDALRILRAVRFSAQLDFTIEHETMRAIQKKADKLSYISMERIRDEFNKLLLSSHPERLAVCYETGITDIIFPEVSAVLAQKKQRISSQYPTKCPLLCVLMSLQKLYGKQTQKERLVLLWSAILIFSGLTVERGKGLLQYFRFDNDTIHDVLALMGDYFTPLCGSEIEIRHMMSRIGSASMKNMFVLKEAALAVEDKTAAEIGHKNLLAAKKVYEKVSLRGDCVSLKELKINGKDLIAEGFLPGKQLGYVLEQLLEQVLWHPEDNQKERLLVLAKLISRVNETNE